MNLKIYNPLGPESIGRLAFTFSTRAERSFLTGVDTLKAQNYEEAYDHLRQALREDPQFYDAIFLSAAILLGLGRKEAARQRFLKLLSVSPKFHGVYIARFIPGFRLKIEIYPGYVCALPPTASGAAIALGVMYLKEGALKEAKKLLQQSIKADFTSYLARILLADALVQDGHPEAGSKLIGHSYTNLSSPLEAIAMFIRGQASLADGDTNSGLLQLCGAPRFPFEGHDALHDYLCVEAAREVERWEYLEDVHELLEMVKDKACKYTEGETVLAALERLRERLRAMHKAGITKPLTISWGKRKTRFRKEDFWELGSRG